MRFRDCVSYKPVQRHLRREPDDQRYPWWNIRVERGGRLHHILLKAPFTRRAYRLGPFRKYDLRRARRKCLIEERHGIIYLTQDGKNIRTAMDLDLMPMAAWILGMIYRYTRGAGFYMRNYRDLHEHNISYNQLDRAFAQLSRRRLVARLDAPRTYHVPPVRMAYLRRYDAILMGMHA